VRVGFQYANSLVISRVVVGNVGANSTVGGAVGSGCAATIVARIVAMTVIALSTFRRIG